MLFLKFVLSGVVYCINWISTHCEVSELFSIQKMYRHCVDFMEFSFKAMIVVIN